jgi:type VI secretion system protein VasG
MSSWWLATRSSLPSLRCTEAESGARNVDHILAGHLMPLISTELLTRMGSGQKVAKLVVTLAGDGFAVVAE